MTIRIVIADDHAVVAEGLRSLINVQDDMEVVGLAGNGRDAIRLALETRPDMVVMDNAMPELNGIEAARVIRNRCPDTRAEGDAIVDIAAKLSLSCTTVETYRERMTEKLGLGDFAGLVKFAIQQGVIPLG